MTLQTSSITSNGVRSTCGILIDGSSGLESLQSAILRLGELKLRNDFGDVFSSDRGKSLLS